MSNTELDETRLTDSLHRLAGRATPSPDALDAVRVRHQRHRRNRARMAGAGGGALALVLTLVAVNVVRSTADTEVSSTDRAPVASQGDEASTGDGFLPALVSVKWLKPMDLVLFEGRPEDRPDRWVQSMYRGDDGRIAQLVAWHRTDVTVEKMAAERDGEREEVAGPRGARVILVSDRGRYWAYWTEGEWQFELDAGAIPSKDDVLEILQAVAIDASEFERVKLALRDHVSLNRPGPPPVEAVVIEGSPDGMSYRVTELTSPEGQRCLGLEPGSEHRWFCLPADAGAFIGEQPSIAPGPKLQFGDFWLYAALVDVSTTVSVRTEGPAGVQTVTLTPAPLRDGRLGVAVGFLPSTVERITTEFIDPEGNTTYTTTQSMSGG